MVNIVLLILIAAQYICGDISGLCADALNLSLTQKRVDRLFNRKNLIDVFAEFEYRNIYHYQNEQEFLPNFTYGPIDQSALLSFTRAETYFHTRHLSMGMHTRLYNLDGDIDFGDTSRETYLFERPAEEMNADALLVYGPFGAGGGMDPVSGNKHLFGFVSYKGATLKYIHDIFYNIVNAVLNPAAMVRNLNFKLRHRSNYYEIAYKNSGMKTSAYYSPFSVLGDSTLHSDDNMSSLIYFSGKRLGLSFQSTKWFIQPDISFDYFDCLGFVFGYYQSVKYSAFDSIQANGARLKVKLDLPFKTLLGYENRRLGVKNPEGFLEATPFNSLNIFTHTYYKVIEPELMLNDNMIFMGKSFDFFKDRWQVAGRLGYDWIKLKSGYQFKEREYILFFLPTYGPVQDYELADVDEDFILVRLASAYRWKWFRVKVSGEQFIPFPDLKDKEAPPVEPSPPAGPATTEPDVSGGTKINVSLEFHFP